MKDRDGNEWVLVPASLTTDMACGAMSVWADGGKDFGQMYAAAIAASPQFIAPEVTDEMCISVGEEFSRINAVNCGKLVTPSIRTSRSMIAAVRAELGPNLGLVELREPTEADARITELETAITIRDTEIARLETDLELARVDQARYRWLRSGERGMSGLSAVINDDCQPPYYELKCEKELDAAIDAARGVK